LVPDIPHGQIQLAPILPDRLLPLQLEHVPLAGARIDIAVQPDGRLDVHGLPGGVRLVTTADPKPVSTRSATNSRDR
jgi:hypothetical protein